MTTYTFFATTTRGLESLLRSELQALGATSARTSQGGVTFQGPLELAYKANLWLRTANHILLALEDFPCQDYESLYACAKTIEWHHHFKPGQRFAVTVEARGSSPITNTHFATQKIKDAVVDQLRARQGRRPSVDVRAPDLSIHAYLHADQVRFSLDLSGEALFKRRYRVKKTQAPLKESLAAGLIGLAGWTTKTPLQDPMCGSGTIAIEAAQLALNLAPGRHRSFLFQNHPSFDNQATRQFRQLLEEADDRALQRAEVPIIARDADPSALEAARANAKAAGVAGAITFETRDVRDLVPQEPGSYLISNPPYGHRLENRGEHVVGLYRLLGEKLRAFPLQNVWLLCAHPSFETAMQLSPRARHRLFNGPLETWFFGYVTGHHPRRR